MKRKLIVPKGKYWVYDPCYVVRDEEWKTVCYYGDDDTPVPITNGITFCFSTMHGDGYYYDDSGREYPVDSGTIGLTSYEHNPNFKPFDESKKESNYLVEFTEDTVCTCDADGVLQFGDIITIETCDNNDSVEYEEEEFCEADYD
jgi:hypothetical protein